MKKSKGKDRHAHVRRVGHRVARELQLAVAKQTLDRYQKDGYQTARFEMSRLENVGADTAILAAFAKGGAGAYLYEGFRHMTSRGDESAGADFLRLVLSALAHDVKRDFGVDLDIFLVGPEGHKLLGHEAMGRRVEPRGPKTVEEKRAQVDAVRCALEAASEQLRQVGLRAAAESLATGAAALEDLKKRVTP